MMMMMMWSNLHSDYFAPEKEHLVPTGEEAGCEPETAWRLLLLEIVSHSPSSLNTAYTDSLNVDDDDDYDDDDADDDDDDDDNDDDSCLLEYNRMSIGKYLPKFLRACCLHLQAISNMKRADIVINILKSPDNYKSQLL
jgi:hypothetical protein